MTGPPLFALLGAVLVAAGFGAFVGRTHLLWKIVALNITASGIFLLLVTLAPRVAGRPDPVPQAMVLTGIVVAVAATAFALALALRVAAFSAGRGSGADET